MDDTDLLDAPAARAKPIPRESWRQEKAITFAREAVTCPCVVLGFDRSQARGEWSHRFEAKRGVRAGTPDTLTIVKIKPDRSLHIWVEWKAAGNKPSETQRDVANLLATVGDMAFWCTTIEQYHDILRDYSVPMLPGAHVMAMRYDGMVDSRIAKAEAKSPTVKKSRPRRPEPRFTAGKNVVKRATKRGLRFA